MSARREIGPDTPAVEVQFVESDLPPSTIKRLLGLVFESAVSAAVNR